ncbi:MAG: ribosome silencing factor [Bacteroidales bacterium]|nr:ribosome silencing factor [Bacteroidales bacterium]
MEESESMNVGQKSQLIIDAIQEKKGKQIVTIDLSQVENSICDSFIICHGESVTQVGAITGSIEKKLKENAGIRAHHTEGLQNSQWVLIDFFDVLVHIFLEEYRSFFNLEGLWADGKVVKVKEA